MMMMHDDDYDDYDLMMHDVALDPCPWTKRTSFKNMLRQYNVFMYNFLLKLKKVYKN